MSKADRSGCSCRLMNKCFKHISLLASRYIISCSASASKHKFRKPISLRNRVGWEVHYNVSTGSKNIFDQICHNWSDLARQSYVVVKVFLSDQGKFAIATRLRIVKRHFSFWPHLQTTMFYLPPFSHRRKSKHLYRSL